ncbi:nuclear transport factor 2 family protein [Leucobacter sp. 7(1)]|uniref:nuclear transport factor 2 family protein n=1 Tax=Leucobacter sp. 7(1) TaxID=1255613 RepID=UPI000B34F5CB|nr:nuclear transport factor 2 family protein [Leucobacter sp. 7(1)]
MHTGVKAAVQLYIDGCAAADPSRVADAFDAGAVMWGYLGSEYVTMTGAEFATQVVGTAVPAGPEYRAEIQRIEVTGKVASAVLVESGFLGADFRNELGLVERDGRWRIVSKVFTTLAAE